MIYHYTSIETLKLIVESKKIRFNNLNAVDDELESDLFTKRSLAQLIFVSCWTTDANENISLWTMYASTRGLRIGLPDYPWKKVDCKKWNTGAIDLRYIALSEYFSPFEINEIFGKNHIIIPPYCLPTSDRSFKKAFSKNVIYLPDFELESRYSNYYEERITSSGHVEFKINPLEFGLHKHEQWAFQKEFRFVLFICPIDSEVNISERNINEVINPSLMKYIHAEAESPLKDFYVNLDPLALKCMEITLGPHCTEEDISLVQSLKEKYGIHGDLNKSGVRMRIK